jgi:hypothetical protein
MKEICGTQDRGGKMRRHLVALIGACVVAAAVLVSPAGADPIHAKNALQVQAVCGTRTLTAVTNGNGVFTPAHIIGSTSVFIPTAFNLTLTFTPTGGATMTDHNTAAKASPLHKKTMTCTIPFQSFPSPQGTFTIQGTVTGFITPR